MIKIGISYAIFVCKIAVMWCGSCCIQIRCIILPLSGSSILPLSFNQSINQSINQKAFIVSSTVIKTHSNHGNIRHHRNKWKQKAYRYLLRPRLRKLHQISLKFSIRFATPHCLINLPILKSQTTSITGLSSSSKDTLTVQDMDTELLP